MAHDKPVTEGVLINYSLPPPRSVFAFNNPDMSHLNAAESRSPLSPRILGDDPSSSVLSLPRLMPAIFASVAWVMADFVLSRSSRRPSMVTKYGGMPKTILRLCTAE
jgi:hypothetical protein